MKRGRLWSGIVGIIGGGALVVGGGCTVQQQQQVLGTIGQAIPGASNSMFGSSGSSSSESQAATPAPRVDPNRVEAQLVLYTLQRAMTDNPSPFQECLDKAECKSALAAHLIRLQKQAMSTLELPPAYDRYDLKRGKE